MVNDLNNRYVIKHKITEQYISTLTLPPQRSKLCIERENAYKFHDKEWIKEKLRFYRDSDIYEIIEI